MSSPAVNQSLAEGFDPVTDEEWRQAATKGADPEQPLETEIEPGLSTNWLYVPADQLAADPAGAPAQSPFVRGTRDGLPWQIRQEQVNPSREAANAEILEDLNGGVTEIALRLDRAAREARVPARFQGSRGDGGVAVSTLDDLARVLDGVYLDLAPVALDAGAAAIPAAALLSGLWRSNGIEPARASGSFGIDPIGTLAATGSLPRPAAEELALAASVAAETAATYRYEAGQDPDTPRFGVRSLAVGTSAYAEAGATAAWELGIAIATATEYLRATERAGLDPETAAAQIEFRLSAGPDQFLEIAKFRAVRRVWARVLEASGVDAQWRNSPTYARVSSRMLTVLDPWTNMLRVTTAAFAAGLGGADGVTVVPFDRSRVEWDPTGEQGTGTPGKLGRRVARNTQIILQEESSLGGLADPAAGSWYVESLSDRLAHQAWERFQEIESWGGMLAGVTSGRIADRLAELADQRQSRLRHRKRLMTGVNIFPLLGEDGVEVEAGDRDQLARQDAERLAARPQATRLDQLTEVATTVIGGGAGNLLESATSLAEGGARLDEIAAGLATEPFTVAPLAPAPDAIAFERLRGAVQAHTATGGEQPRILLACLGPIARHVNAANWARSFFEAAGIEAINSVEIADTPDPDQLDDPTAAAAPDASALGELLPRSDARIAAICAGKDESPQSVAAAVASLRDAGAARVYLAAPTAEQAEGSEADEIVKDGVDMVAVLGSALQLVGVKGLELPTAGADPADSGEERN